MMLDVNAVYQAENEKRRADGMGPLTPEQFLEDFMFDVCMVILVRRPELLTKASLEK